MKLSKDSNSWSCQKASDDVPAGSKLSGALLLIAFLLLSAFGAFAQSSGVVYAPAFPPPSNEYPLGPDSEAHPAVPAGKTFTFEWTASKLFPDTIRTITVYVPQAYHAAKPACVYVGFDGLGYRAPVVFDNLIQQKAMPVTIAIGISPGIVNSAKAHENPRFDRSFEFDSLTGRFANFVLDEVLPEVERHKTPDGEPIVLSKDPNDRATGGGSTGAIAAFTLAWERPDAFRRVFTSIGTFVGMRGGERYNVLVRKTEPKPIRIFMQDGVHDEWPGGPEMGDWWMSNETMERALSFAGYDVRHIWGAGTHNGNQAQAVFPAAMRWLWRDYPQPIKALPPGNPVLKTILEPGEDWQVAATGCNPGVRLASNPSGGLVVADSGGRNVVTISDDGKVCSSKAGLQPVALGADGHSHFDPQATAIAVRSNGDQYITTKHGRELWLIRVNGQKVRLDSDIKSAAGFAFSPDGLWLFVAQSVSRWGLSYRVRGDGTVDAKEAFYDFAVPGTADDSGAGDVWMDQTGLAYVSTRMGVQVFDRNGRVGGILPMPGNTAASSLCFGGQDFHTLYVQAGGTIYRRRMKSAGAPPWAAPITLPKWGAG